jgi:hypothetical protein
MDSSKATTIPTGLRVCDVFILLMLVTFLSLIQTLARENPLWSMILSRICLNKLMKEIDVDVES